MPGSTPFGCDVSAQDTQRPKQLDILAIRTSSLSNWTLWLSAQDSVVVTPQNRATGHSSYPHKSSQATGHSNNPHKSLSVPSNWTMATHKAGLCQAQNTILKQHQLGKEGYDKSPTQRTTWPSPSKGCYPPPQSTGGLIQRTSKSKSAPTRGARHCPRPKGHWHSPWIRTLGLSNWTLWLSAQVPSATGHSGYPHKTLW